MTTISRKNWRALDTKWTELEYVNGTVTGGRWIYYLRIAGKFREVALVD